MGNVDRTLRWRAVMLLLALLAPVVTPVGAENLVPGDTDRLDTFRWVIEPGHKVTLQTRNFPAGWGGNFWSDEGSGELTLDKVPGTDVVAFGIVNQSKPPSGQLYAEAAAPAGHYKLTFAYLTRGDAAGRFELRAKQRDAVVVAQSSVPTKDGANGIEFELPKAAQWATVTASVQVKADTGVSLMFQNGGGVGAESGFYFRNIALEPAKADGSALSPEDVVPQAPDAYHAALRKELAEKHGLPGGFSLLGATEDAVIARFHRHGPAADAATMAVVPVEGQPFTKAMRFEVQRLSGEFWHTMLQALSPVPVKKGDVMLVTCYARGGVTNVAGSPALTGVSIKPIPGDPHGWQTRELVLDDQWRRITLPVVAAEDREAGKVEWISALSTKIQWIEFGGISVINFGPGVDVAQLPDSAAVKADYAGREAGAAWRTDALARIERHRTSELTVSVVDAAGKPVPDADVKVEMTRSAFRWGTSSIPGFSFIEPIPDWGRAGAEVDRKYLFELFNSTTIDIVLKHDWWAKASEAEKQRQLEGIKYVHDRGLRVRGHTMVWPSFTNMPSLRPLAGEPDKLRQAVVDHIKDVGSRTREWCDEWDVVNEPYGNQEITRIVGPDSLALWFRTTREVVPDAMLYINEGVTPGNGSATDAYYYDVCRELLAGGAPVDGIGFQCHIGNTPLDIDKLWAGFERYAKLKPDVKLAVTEFDINCRGDTRLEGDYTRDLLILTYSHPQMTGFTMWGYYGTFHWLKYAPLFDEHGNVREAGKPWFDLVLGQWKTKAAGKTDAAGTYTTRGHHGDYTITVTAGGKTESTTSSLTPGGAAVRIVVD